GLRVSRSAAKFLPNPVDCVVSYTVVVFFFQAEDGIRDRNVTGVQTCALPILETFDQLGYYIDFNVFNSKYYDVPQNRERIYIVGKRKDLVDNPKYQEKVKGKKKLEEVHNWAVDNINYVKLLPKLKTEVTTRLIDVLEDEVDEKYYLSEEKTKKLTLDNDLGGKLNMYDFNERDTVHSVNKVSPTLNTMQGGDRQPKIAVLGNTSHTGYKAHDVHDINGDRKSTRLNSSHV